MMSSDASRSRQGEFEHGEKTDGNIELSLVHGDAGYRLQHRLGLIPDEGMAVGRRVLSFVAVTWLPLIVAAWWARRTGGVSPGLPLISLEIHARCLIAIPLFVYAEGWAHTFVPRLIAYFVHAGLVQNKDLLQFRELISDVVQLRNRITPWVFIFGVVATWTIAEIFWNPLADMNWPLGTSHASKAATFVGWWIVLVVRPLFFSLLLVWLWRTVLVFILCMKLAKFPLFIVPVHPDHAGGMDFVQRLASIFSPVALAISAVVAAAFAHEVIYDGVSVMDLKFELVGAAILVTLVFLLPFFPLSIPLTRAKRKAVFDYGVLVAKHGRLVHRRWIFDEDIGEPPLLDAPELGPVADVQAMFEAVQQMRARVVDKLALALIAIPAVLPLLLVVLIQVPVITVIGRILQTLM